MAETVPALGMSSLGDHARQRTRYRRRRSSAWRRRPVRDTAGAASTRYWFRVIPALTRPELEPGIPRFSVVLSCAPSATGLQAIRHRTGRYRRWATSRILRPFSARFGRRLRSWAFSSRRRRPPCHSPRRRLSGQPTRTRGPRQRGPTGRRADIVIVCSGFLLHRLLASLSVAAGFQPFSPPRAVPVHTEITPLADYSSERHAPKRACAPSPRRSPADRALVSS